MKPKLNGPRAHAAGSVRNRTLSAGVALAAIAAMAGTLAASAPASAGSATASATIPQTDCFWTARMDSKFSTDPARNYAFPDTGAVYWSAQVNMPAGSKIVLKGQYAHSRYQSINVYDDATHTPTDALNDVNTKPDPGSVNPYLSGARRDGKQRSYTITVVNEPAPANRAPNTIYAGVAGQVGQALMYRIYEPEPFKESELTGGVGLPAAELHLADGTVLTGQAACSALQAKGGTLPLTKLPEALYKALREPAGASPTFPAAATPIFRAFYSIPWATSCWYGGQCTGSPARTGGQYSNIDNQYVAAFVNRGFPAGPVLVLKGKLPTTPKTSSKVTKMGSGQMRYWSMCQNESLYTTKGAGCLYDSQIPVDKNRNYTIVTSLSGDRPKNATTKCGIGYIPWPKNGDGAGNVKDGLLLVRNMLPASSFSQAIQNTKTPGDEAKVMGAYLPKGSYTTKKKFESKGC